MAPPDKVFQAASDVLEWPRLLPHYRWVTRLGREGKVLFLEMAAHRDGFPVQWRAEQRCDPKKGEVYYLHNWGWTRGMEVWWRLRKSPGGCQVVLTHELKGKPFGTGWFYKHVICDFFVHDIAQKTLEGLKKNLEE